MKVLFAVRSARLLLGRGAPQASRRTVVNANASWLGDVALKGSPVVAVIGGGAMGSLWSAYLANAGARVYVISGWAAQRTAIQSEGLALHAPLAHAEAPPWVAHNITAVAPEAVDSIPPVDLALVMVKSAATAAAGSVAARVLRPKLGAVVTLQNGLGHVQTLRKELDALTEVVVGVTSNGTRMFGPGHVLHAGAGSTTLACSSPAQAPLAEAVAALFSRAGLATTVDYYGFEALVWGKLSTNAVINPLTALLNEPNAVVLEPGWRRLVAGIAAEVEAVAHKGEIVLPFVDACQAALDVAHATRDNISSMLSDVRRGASTEITAINGAVVAEGRRLGVATPLNLELFLAVLALEARADSHDRWSRQSVSRLRGLRPVGTQVRALSTARTIAEMRAWRAGLPSNATVGFVPTMGALHAGHIALMRQARAECDILVSSVFVNPTQFAAHEDLGSYPRTMEEDLHKCVAAGVDYVFAPGGPEVMYPRKAVVTLHVQGADKLAEGACRPHFFHAVATVCLKLFNIVQPHRVYFGQKDAQQVATIRSMLVDLNVPAELVVCPIVRDHDGLALSSRNRNLTPEHRRLAPAIFASLQHAEMLFCQGERSALVLIESIRQQLLDVPGARIEYIDVADALTMQTANEAQPLAGSVCVSVVVRLGAVRLLDNIVLPSTS